MPREVWAPDEYPLWFQGLVYFLTPQHTGELFNTALDLHYMHTDDVFVGILVNKTNSIRPGATILKDLSVFAPLGFKIEETLRPEWNKRSIPFFHLPDIGIYYTWALEDLEEVNMPEVPWFQW